MRQTHGHHRMSHGASIFLFFFSTQNTPVCNTGLSSLMCSSPIARLFLSWLRLFRTQQLSSVELSCKQDESRPRGFRHLPTDTEPSAHTPHHQKRRPEAASANRHQSGVTAKIQKKERQKKREKQLEFGPVDSEELRLKNRKRMRIGGADECPVSRNLRGKKNRLMIESSKAKRRKIKCKKKGEREGIKRLHCPMSCHHLAGSSSHEHDMSCTAAFHRRRRASLFFFLLAPAPGLPVQLPSVKYRATVDLLSVLIKSGSR